MADLHRKIGAGPLPRGRPARGHRALPEGHQPPQGRPAAARAGAPVRGGRLALPAHGRQHAGDLRLGEGPAAGRAAGRDARRQPCARDLRARVRPHRRHREGAPEPRARGGAGSRAARRALGFTRRAGRDDRGAVRPGPPPRGIRGRHGRRPRGVRGGARAGRADGHAPRPGRAARLAGAAGGVQRGLGGRGALHRGERRAGRARGARGQAERSLRAARVPALARGPDRRGHRALPSSARAGRAGGLVGDRLPGAVRPGHRASRLRRSCRRERRARPRPRRVRARRADRTVDPGHGGARGDPHAVTAAARRRPRPPARPPSWPSALHYPIGRAAALEARGVCADEPREGAALLDEAAAAWTALDRPLEAARSRLLAGQPLVRRRSRPRPASGSRRRPRRSSSSACPTCRSARCRSQIPG